MNSEELEQSLKTEFEIYLKTVLAEMKQETAAFQSQIETEFEKQKSQIDEAFRTFAARFDSDRIFDAPFTGSVAEHLRLARDEGAKIAANAMVAAENLGQSPLNGVASEPPVEAKYDAIRDAVTDISSKDSQSTILKALVHHAANFAPRGAFFIIKSEHFSGWKVFGADDAAENAIRDIHFPVSSDSILGAAISERVTADNSNGSRTADAAFINPLQFGEPAQMYAVPLVARGRGVAVLYADHGTSDTEEATINQEALETIVRVAGLTVELLASMQTAKAENRTVGAADFEDVPSRTDVPTVPHLQEPTDEESQAVAEPAYQEPQEVAEPGNDFSEPAPQPAFEMPFQETGDDAAMAFAEEREEEPSFAFNDSVSYDGGLPEEVSSNPFDAEPASYSPFDQPIEKVEVPVPVEEAHDESPFAERPYPGDAAMRQAELDAEAARNSPVETFQPSSDVFAAEPETVETPFNPFSPTVPAFQPASFETEPEQPTESDMVFDSTPAFEAPPVVSSPFEQPRESFEPAAVVSSGGFAPQVTEAVIEAPVIAKPQPRLSDRNVDLPIEVPEEDRRIHNDARRFARLLVSEIKLYNEKKVTEGREASDLYDRLREAIDRSREMYDKRVQPPVAAKFDYFHYEIVNSLAEGSAERLGSGYPGASV